MRPKTTSKKTVAETFDPKVLDSTMVAIPLLEAIADVKEAQGWMKDHAKLRVENYNAVIFFARDYPEGIRAAQRQVEDLLEQILSQLDSLEKENRLLQKRPTLGKNETSQSLISNVVPASRFWIAIGNRNFGPSTASAQSTLT
jgi:hypothetical protein